MEGFRGSVRYLRDAFSGFTLTIEDLVADDDKVWVRMTARGTHTKMYMGRPPTGKSFGITVIDVCRFTNGKLVEHWGVPDRLHLMLQLGLLPPPGTVLGEAKRQG